MLFLAKWIILWKRKLGYEKVFGSEHCFGGVCDGCAGFCSSCRA
jgi:hypothetical protein